MDYKPSDIHRKRMGGMTRRRLLKTLTAFGFSASTAAALTSDDVQAADSDQVPISIDHSGKSIVMVDADWYDRLQKTRDNFDAMKRDWLPQQGRRNANGRDRNTNSEKSHGPNDEHDDVIGLFISAGKDNDNPHIIISIDQDSDTKDETRGNIPERRGGSRIEIEEMDQQKELATVHTDCEDEEVSNPDKIPGGVRISFAGRDGYGTLTPRIVDGSFDHTYSLATAAHVLSRDENECGDDFLGTSAYHHGNYIGDVVAVDHDLDMAIVHNSSSWDQPIPEVWHPADHSERWEPIEETLTSDGVDYWINNDRQVWKYGVSTCFTTGKVHSRGNTERAYNYAGPGPDVSTECADYWYECVRWGEFGSIEAGDSGSITFGAHPDRDTFLACNINSWRWSSFSDGEYSAGPAGYAWQNDHSYWWKDEA